MCINIYRYTSVGISIYISLLCQLREPRRESSVAMSTPGSRLLVFNVIL